MIGMGWDLGWLQHMYVPIFRWTSWEHLSCEDRKVKGIHEGTFKGSMLQVQLVSIGCSVNKIHVFLECLIPKGSSSDPSKQKNDCWWRNEQPLSAAIPLLTKVSVYSSYLC
jgi:hypothetical protein